MSSNVLTLVAIFLPLSSLWASASIRSRIQPSPGAEIRHAMLGSDQTGSTTAGSSGPLIREKFGGPLSPAKSDMTATSKSSIYKAGLDRHLDDDIESQAMGK